MAQIEKDTSKIVGLLHYGPFRGKSLKRIIIFNAVLMLFFLGFMALAFVMLYLEQSEPQHADESYAFSYFVLAVVTIIIPILDVISIVMVERMRKKVLLWLEDAIEVKAYSQKVGIGKHLLSFILPAVKLQLDFDIDGIHHTCYSESKGLEGLENIVGEGGYQRLWSKYADREISILYSPKYDEVMVLRENKVKEKKKKK